MENHCIIHESEKVKITNDIIETCNSIKDIILIDCGYEDCSNKVWDILFYKLEGSIENIVCVNCAENESLESLLSSVKTILNLRGNYGNQEIQNIRRRCIL